mmetsp:Transcript_21560/g.69600  ORF Transcript_21560/g.69600 Transcript_21560/m.69600 type:complete len:313 (-) Transcript_21560:1577-2515(-)
MTRTNAEVGVAPHARCSDEKTPEDAPDRPCDGEHQTAHGHSQASIQCGCPPCPRGRSVFTPRISSSTSPWSSHWACPDRIVVPRSQGIAAAVHHRLLPASRPLSYSRCILPPDIRFSKKPGPDSPSSTQPESKYFPFWMSPFLSKKLFASSSNCSAAPPSASGLSKLVFLRSPSIGAPAPIAMSCARPLKSMLNTFFSPSSFPAFITTMTRRVVCVVTRRVAAPVMGAASCSPVTPATSAKHNAIGRILASSTNEGSVEQISWGGSGHCSASGGKEVARFELVVYGRTEEMDRSPCSQEHCSDLGQAARSQV